LEAAESVFHKIKTLWQEVIPLGAQGRSAPAISFRKMLFVGAQKPLWQVVIPLASNRLFHLPTSNPF
jgi:hypothetical protein